MQRPQRSEDETMSTPTSGERRSDDGGKGESLRSVEDGQ